MHFVSLHCASIGIDARKCNILAEIISPFSTKEALLAGNARLNRDPIT